MLEWLFFREHRRRLKIDRGCIFSCLFSLVVLLKFNFSRSRNKNMKLTLNCPEIKFKLILDKLSDAMDCKKSV